MLGPTRLPGQAAPPAGTVGLRLLGVNDFHGHLQPPEPGLGGAAWLTGDLDEATVPGHTIRVHAGDMVGASPLVSSWFHDEPAIEAANLMGFDVGTVGNHEFDEGGDELLRLLRGGRRTGPEALKRDAGDHLVNTSSPGFAWGELSLHGGQHGGAAERAAPAAALPGRGASGREGGLHRRDHPVHTALSSPRYADRFRFLDISDAVNHWVPELRRRGVEAIVVLAHSGAPSQEGDGAKATGEVVDEARQMSDAVDVVIAGHSHSRLDLRVPERVGPGDKLVVEADAYGTAFDRVDLVGGPATARTWCEEAQRPGRSRRDPARPGRRPGGAATRADRPGGRAGRGRRTPQRHSLGLGTLAARPSAGWRGATWRS